MAVGKGNFSNINTAITVLQSLGAFFFLYYTYHHPQQISIFPTINSNSSKDKIQIITNLALASVLVILSLSFFSCILTKFFKKSQNSEAMKEISSSISGCFLHSIIILSFFSYILTHGKFGLNQQQISLYSHWIFVALASTAVGSLLRAQTQYNFKEFGYVLTGFLQISMFSQVYGFSPLGYF